MVLLSGLLLCGAGQLGPDAVKVGGAHVAPGDCTGGKRFDGGHVVDGDGFIPANPIGNLWGLDAQMLGEGHLAASLFCKPCL